MPFRSHWTTWSHLVGCLGLMGSQVLLQKRHCVLKSNSLTYDLLILELDGSLLTIDSDFLFLPANFLM